eukprot:gene13335-28255_t
MINLQDLLTKIKQERGQPRIDACSELKHLCEIDDNKCLLVSNSNLIPVLVEVINEDASSARLFIFDAILDLAKDNSNKVPLTSSEYGLIPAIVNILNQEGCEARDKACLAINVMSWFTNVEISIRMTDPHLGLLSALVKLIEKENGVAQEYALGAMLNIAGVKEIMIHLLAPDLRLLEILIKVINLDTGIPRHIACITLNNICCFISSNAQTVNLFLQSQTHILILNILNQGGPVPSEWKSKGDYMPYMLECLMNLCRQFCAAEALKAAGAVDVITPLLTDTSIEGLKALFLMVFLIGKDEASSIRESESLLQAHPHTLTLLIDVLSNTLNCLGDEQYTLGTFELVVILSACLSLAISDSNKASLVSSPLLSLLIKALEQFVNNMPELQDDGGSALGGGDDVESASLVIEVMLQLSFAFDSDEDLQLHYMPHSIGIETLLRGACNLPSDRKVSLDDSAICSANRLLRRLTSTPLSSPEKNIINNGSGPLSGTQTASFTHVMLSYSWSVGKDLVTAFGKALSEKGYEVWRDEEGSALVPAMAGATDDVMADAVEHSYAVVIFVSLAYKQSANCRMEAKYSNEMYKRGKLKQIIYVMMDPNYHTRSAPQQVDGWLGFMVSDSLWYPLWSEQDISATVISVVNRLGVNALKPRSYVTSPTSKAPRELTAISTPKKDEIQTVKSVPNPESKTFSLKSDYDLAWKYLSNPSKHKTPEQVVFLMEELGLSEASELFYVLPDEVQALAVCLKPVAKRAFEGAMKGQWKDETGNNA